MAIRECQVSFVDQRGSGTPSPFTPAAYWKPLQRDSSKIRETEMIGDDGVEDLTVDIKTTTSHKVPLFKLKVWLEAARDPREAALKTKLR
jgi:hypothetical protein